MKFPQFFFEADGGGGSGGGGDTLISTPAATTPAVGTETTPPTGFAWANEGGDFNAGWLDKLPEDLRGNPSLRVINNLPDLARNYIQTKSMIGKKLEMPGEGATPEQIASWRKTVGAPDKPEGYRGDAKSLRPDSVPEEHWNPEVETKFLELAHKHSLTPSAVKEILNLHGDMIGGSLKTVHEQQANILAAEGEKLRQAWGSEYDANLNGAGQFARTIGLDPANAIFTNADVVQAFAKAAKLISEDKLVVGENSGVNGSATGRIKEITDPTSTTMLSREYRGEHGPERQAQAQQILHGLMASQK